MSKKPKTRHVLTKGLSKPHLFAPKPIANKLQPTRTVGVYEYVEGKGINFENPTTVKTFSDIDLNIWGLQLFEFIDYLFSPKPKAFIQLLDSKGDNNFFQQLLHAKKLLIQSTCNLIVPVYEKENWNSNFVRKHFKEELDKKLCNAYSIKAIIEFSDTNVDTPSVQSTENCKIIIDKKSFIGDNIEVKGPLLHSQSGDESQMAFIIKATNDLLVANVSLHLVCPNIKIEDNNEAKATIVENGIQAKDLTRISDSFEVPMFINSYPSSLCLVSQEGQSNMLSLQTIQNTNGPLSDFLEWNYSLVYSKQVSYPQDEIKVHLNFNTSERTYEIKKARSEEKDNSIYINAIDQIARFYSVKPNFQNDLTQFIQTFDAQSNILKDFDKATILLQSICKLVTDIAEADFISTNQLNETAAQDENNTKEPLDYSFTLCETEDLICGVNALVVHITGIPPKGIKKPVIGIDGYTSKSHDPPTGIDFCYYFENKDGILSAEIGHYLPERKIELIGINIMERQQVFASLELVRNRELVSKKPSNPSFVFTGQNLNFISSFRPLLEVNEFIDISALDSTNVSKQTLDFHLIQFFDSLLSKFSQVLLNFKMVVAYSYKLKGLTEGIQDVRIPVLLIPPSDVKFKDDKNKLYSLLKDTSNYITDWLIRNKPDFTGRLYFDLDVFHNSPDNMEMIRFSNLYLPLETLTLNEL